MLSSQTRSNCESVCVDLQKSAQVEKLKLQKELTEVVENHQKEVADLIRKHQKELAEAVSIQQQERAHRERLENELANQQQELALCERLEKELLDGAQPQHQRKEVLLSIQLCFAPCSSLVKIRITCLIVDFMDISFLI